MTRAQAITLMAKDRVARRIVYVGGMTAEAWEERVNAEICTLCDRYPHDLDMDLLQYYGWTETKQHKI